MEKNLMEINDETCGIAAKLENIDGQMTFFDHLIQDCEQYPKISAIYLEYGEIQKQLNAIYTFFHYQLEEIKEYNNKINTLSSTKSLSDKDS